MPSNSVEESALRLATFKQEAHETASAYYLRQRVRVSKVGSTCYHWALAVRSAFGHPVSTWTYPVHQVSVIVRQSVKSLREAVDRARRHEATNLTGRQPQRQYCQRSVLHACPKPFLNRATVFAPDSDLSQTSAKHATRHTGF